MFKKLLFSQLPVLILFAFFIAYQSTGYAQEQIPNPDFEDWSGGEPEDWNTINLSYFGYDFICVTEDQSNPQSGMSCAKVETIMQSIIIIGDVTVPGILSLGEVVIDIANQTGTVEGGVPINTQPTILNGYYKYEPAVGDQGIIGVGLTRWNGTSRDTLSTDYISFNTQVSSWQEFSIPINYQIWAMPDTINIMVFSSNIISGSPIAGSTLWVDNLSLGYGPTSVNHFSDEEDKLFVLANNGSNIQLGNVPEEGGQLRIIDINGTVLCNEQVASGSTLKEINMSGMPRGIYIAQFTSLSGQQQVVKFFK